MHCGGILQLTLEGLLEGGILMLNSGGLWFRAEYNHGKTSSRLPSEGHYEYRLTYNR